MKPAFSKYLDEWGIDQRQPEWSITLNHPTSKNEISIIMARLGVPDKICMQKADVEFIALSANEITKLTKALAVAVDELNKAKGALHCADLLLKTEYKNDYLSHQGENSPEKNIDKTISQIREILK